ncbi:MAG: hypothetical protein JWR07_4877 [Nevskia sp.]|nr:hypothetical protein [Nevskia sp.]
MEHIQNERLNQMTSAGRSEAEVGRRAQPIRTSTCFFIVAGWMLFLGVAMYMILTVKGLR